jgi:hypothetical protein
MIDEMARQWPHTPLLSMVDDYKDPTSATGACTRRTMDAVLGHVLANYRQQVVVGHAGTGYITLNGDVQEPTLNVLREQVYAPLRIWHELGPRKQVVDDPPPEHPASGAVQFARNCMAARYQTEVIVTHGPTWAMGPFGIWPYNTELTGPVDPAACPP